MNMRKHLGFQYLAVATAATLLLSACGKPQETPATTSAPATVGSNVPDADVTYDVTTALLRSDALKGLDIQVVTLKGDVRLIGTVNSQTQIDEALKIARTSVGAHTIHNELTIKK